MISCNSVFEMIDFDPQNLGLVTCITDGKWYCLAAICLVVCEQDNWKRFELDFHKIWGIGKV